jgi:Ca2+-transporting ATPase
LFGPATWHRALLQGGVMAALALAIAGWPDLSAIDRRSLLFTLLLLGGGVLVWLNGESRSRISQLGGAIGLGLWLLLQVIPGLNSLLMLRPLQELTPWVLLVALGILLLSHRFSRSTRSDQAPIASR